MNASVEKISLFDMGDTRRYVSAKCRMIRRATGQDNNLHAGAVVDHKSLYFFFVVHGYYSFGERLERILV